jgi:hypothetical protein
MRRWLVLGAYTALLYGLLPYGPAIGLAVQQSAVGRWSLGRGAVWLVVAGLVAVVLRLWRRAAPPGAYVLAALTVLGYAAALLWLRAIRLERVHLPEYGIAAVLAWRALAPMLGEGWLGYLGAAAVAALIGWGDELVQAVTPGRYYDLRDVAANALGAGLGALALAVWHTPVVHQGAEPNGTAGAQVRDRNRQDCLSCF